MLWVKARRPIPRSFSNTTRHQPRSFSKVRQGTSCSHAAQHSVHPTGGSLRVFRQFASLGVGSDKMALSRPAHQRVTLTVSPLLSIFRNFLYNEYVELSKHSSIKKMTGLEFNTKL